MGVGVFDIDLLRSLVVVVDSGGFARAGRELHRTQSAISHQISRLEESANAKLFEKRGREKVLTPSGELLLGYARRILELNDEAYRVVADSPDNLVRIGLPEYFSEQLLPKILMAYADHHPNTRVTVHLGRSATLRDMVNSRAIDCAMVIEPGNAVPSQSTPRLPLGWVGGDSTGTAGELTEPLPLVVFDLPCAFRSTMTSALDAAGVEWRIGYVANGLADLTAAVRANFGVTALLQCGGSYGLSPLDGLPALPCAGLSIYASKSAEEQWVKDFESVLKTVLETEPGTNSA